MTEIVEKRKRYQMEDYATRHTRTPPSLAALPLEVAKVLDENEKKSNMQLRILSFTETEEECQTRWTDLSDRGLQPHQIRQQVEATLRRANSRQQMLSVVHFLFQMQSAVINGERLPPPDSVFCKVPFSK